MTTHPSVRPIILSTITLVLLLLGLSPLTTYARDPITPAAEPQDVPTTLISSYTNDIDYADHKIWYEQGGCPVLRDGDSGDTATSGAYVLDTIGRIGESGGITRTIFLHETEDACQTDYPDVISPIAADNTFVWWMSDHQNGLVKLRTSATPGTTPTLVYSGQADADDVADYGNSVYLLDDAYGFIRVNKNNGQGQLLATANTIGANPRQLHAVPEGGWWIGNNRLIGYVNGLRLVGSMTYTAQFPDRARCNETQPTCSIPDKVVLAEGHRLRYYDVATDDLGPYFYYSPINGAVITELTADDTYIYFVERRLVGCDPTPVCTYTYGLYRHARQGGPLNDADLLYTFPNGYEGMYFDLQLSGPTDAYLVWRDPFSGAVMRLPRNAAAIPSIDIDILGIEVTQGIQDLDGSVDLIKGKRTIVRVLVQANGAYVPNVTAQLYRLNPDGPVVIGGPLRPTQGTDWLTVPSVNIRSIFKHAFYFELPPDWVDDNSLYLRAVVNPTHIPPEPNYSNNTDTTRLFTMKNSPTVKLHMLMWGFYAQNGGGTLYYPDPKKDGAQARSWMRRIYPIASNLDGFDSNLPGLRWDQRYIYHDPLAEEVFNRSEDCRDRDTDDRAFCASDMVNHYAMLLRLAEGIPFSERIYSMILQPPGAPSLRGYAKSGWNVASGPTRRTSSWDNDGSYGDHYMGHEIAHLFDRDHPAVRPDCGHTQDDDDFPYANAEIGYGSMWGWDLGDPGLNPLLIPQAYSNATWTDNMAYCSFRWFSDYTYRGLYSGISDFNESDALGGHDVPVVSSPRPGAATLAVIGALDTTSPHASFDIVGLWDEMPNAPVPEGSRYSLTLRAANGDTLGFYRFDAIAEDDASSYADYALVVPFIEGTTSLEIWDTSTNTLMGSHAVSTSAPVVSNLRLVNATNPVTGTVTLAWDASDADGDALSYDVYYSADDGATYQTYALAVQTPTVALDTAQMAGSTTARFRVIANDGTRQTAAVSEQFVMAPKAPTVTFLYPGDGDVVPWGATVNFGVEVSDAQGDVPATNVKYYLNGNPFPESGFTLTTDQLPIGENTIEVRATNGAGLTGTASITVIVTDETGASNDGNLSVGPTQFGWQVAAGTTTPLTQSLTIDNSALGTLSWTAAVSDADWLTLSAASGDAPATLTVTADPSSFTANTTATATITITASNGQTVAIPVSLTVGFNPEDLPPVEEEEGWSLFLPVIRR